MQITSELIEKVSNHYAANNRAWRDVVEEMGGSRLRYAAEALVSGKPASDVFSSKEGGDSFDHVPALQSAILVLTCIKLGLEIYKISRDLDKKKPSSEEVAKPLKEILKEDVAAGVAAAVTQACDS